MRYTGTVCILIGRALIVVCAAFASRNTVIGGEEYETDMQAFVEFMDANYTFFQLKNIEDDWAQAKDRFMERAKARESDEEFLLILYDAMRVLRDGHFGIRESRVPFPEIDAEYCPGISFLSATDDRVIVMYPPADLADVLPTGTIVTRIDGQDARQALERRTKESWKAGGFFSSPQRARLFEYRIALRGERGAKHVITFEDKDGLAQSVTVDSSHVARAWPHTYNLPSDLKRVGRSFHYSRLDDDIGYMYLRRVDESVPTGIDEAVKAHPNVQAWVIDLRGNAGGGYDQGLIDRIKDLQRPVVVIIDAGCVSAGETLARDFRRYAEAYIIGSRSGGSSSSKREWTFPSGIATLTIPVRTRWRSDGKPIEFNGIEPDLAVEAIPEEVRAGGNSEILRAVEYLRKQQLGDHFWKDDRPDDEQKSRDWK